MRNLSLQRIIELSRRGIMVIAMDTNGHGLSSSVEDDQITSSDGHGQGMFAFLSTPPAEYSTLQI